MNSAHTADTERQGASHRHRKLRPLAVLATAGAALTALAAPAQALPGGSPIASASTGKCVDISQGSAPDGGPAVQWPCHGGVNQRWHLTRINKLDAVKIRNAQSNRCLDIDQKSTSGGASVHQWDCQDGPGNTDSSAGSQAWTMLARGAARGWSYYVIRNNRSGMCLDLPGATKTDGAPLAQNPCSGNQHQLWRIPS